MSRLEVLCETRAFCVICRDRPDGQRFREQVAAAFTVPAGWPDCPRGLPWGAAAPPAISDAKRAALDASRLAVCKRCDEFNGMVCELRFPKGACCGTCLEWRSNPVSTCPHPAGDRWAEAGIDPNRLSGAIPNTASPGGGS